MKNATAMNENQIRTNLEEYLGRRKSAQVAQEIANAMVGETKHTHNGKNFYIHVNQDGKLELTMESSVKSLVKSILECHLEKDDIDECLEQLMAGRLIAGNFDDIKTILVEDFSSPVYLDILKHNPVDEQERKFLANVRTAVEAKTGEFKVPVCDASIDADGNIRFVPSARTAVGYSYNQLVELGKKNGFKLGTKNQYILFLATMIARLQEEGWSEAEAWQAVCTDSTELGHYYDSSNAKNDFEPTGSRKIAGKCDLANAYKIIAKDEKNGGFWVAGGYYWDGGNNNPLACLKLNNDYDDSDCDSVGWFVL